MHWFGLSWDAPVNDPERQIAPPVGEECWGCGRPIGRTHQGFVLPHVGAGKVGTSVFHKRCFFDELGI